MLPNIDTKTTDLNIEMDLLQKIHKYYPIGLPRANENYLGFRHLKEILEEKINRIITMTLPSECENLLKDLEKTCEGLSVLNEYNKQFPSYSISVELSNTKHQDFRIINMIKVKISLLSNHFTIFYDQTTIFEPLSETMGRRVPFIVNIISSQNTLDYEKKYFNYIKNRVQNYFPSYLFVDNKILFSCLVQGGTPYGLDNSISKSYPIYTYLFDNDYNYNAENCKIVY